MTLTVGARINFSDCFTEGFDTADVKGAKALLEELTDSR